MKALMLAAGMGRRLGPEGAALPKALIEIGGRTLLERHVAVLKAAGVEGLVLAVGFEAARLRAEIDRIGAGAYIETVDNPDFADGSVVTLAALSPALCAGRDFLLMDADVLYDRRMIDALLSTRHANCLLMDRNIEPGDEPVKICVRDGRIVDFHKKVTTAHDLHGESVGFFRFSARVGAKLADRAARYLADGRRGEWYEETIRDLIVGDGEETFGYEDVTGLPWIEIDFPDDIARARRDILPALEDGGR